MPGLFLLPGTIVVIFMLLFAADARHQRRRAREVDAAIREMERIERERRRTEQQQFFTAMKTAAGRNKVSNLLSSGEKSPSTRPIEIEELLDNSGAYSVFAVLPDETVFAGGSPRKRGYAILQVDFRTEGMFGDIHVFRCPYGPERTYGLGELDFVCQALCRHVENFRLFPVDGQVVDETVFQAA